MKNIKSTYTLVALLGLALTSVSAFAQTAVNQTTTTTTSAGTVSEFGPDTIVVRSTTSPEPLRYSYSKTTTYVDETGAPVSIETVKSGLPVTVHYTKVGDQMVASRVIVRRSAPVTTSSVISTSPAIQEQTVSTTTSAGTVSEFGPDTIVVRSTTSPEPLRYTYSKTTTYVDETGAPVSIETVKSGLPVTVHYTKVGDNLVASRVVVRRGATTTVPVVPATPIVEKRTTTVVPAAPIVEKKTTTTTTTKKED